MSYYGQEDADTVDRIKSVVARRFELSPRMLIGPGRHQAVTVPRHIAMYLCRTETRLSLPDIGRAFGGRNHSTVLSAIRKIERLMNSEIGFAEKMTTLLDATKAAAVAA